MKKFLKNAVLIMLVSCFILNIVNLVWQYIEHYTVVQQILNEIQQINDSEIVIENTNENLSRMFATVYNAGFGNKIAIQTGIIVISIVLGITIGMIITFEEKSKIRVILIYILGLILTVLALTMIQVIYYMSFKTFFNDIVYYLESVWKLYTLVFFIIYTIKIHINNKKARKLNEILSKKQKENNLEE